MLAAAQASVLNDFLKTKAVNVGEEHKLKETLTYGWNTSKYFGTDSEWGYEANVYADVGASYSFPLYD